MDYSDFTVIIPTFNENENIHDLLNALIELYTGINIIVADDGSTDGTKDKVLEFGSTKKSVILLDRTLRPVHGITASVMDAVTYATTNYIIVMDGDLQHPPEKVKDIANKLSEGYDVVVGTRQKVVVPWPTHRKMISRIASMLACSRLLISGVFAKDVLSGFFGTKRELFAEKASTYSHGFEQRGYKVLFDFLKLLPRKTKVAEVPYEFGLRTKGESKIKMKHVLLFLRSVLK
jgi:dolichol-phosphate mannosyltransferase